jgi:two-component system LytT family response regulator
MMKELKAIIIDDNELARISLKKDIEEQCPEIDIIGESDGVVQGAKLIRHSNPDVVFLDIHLEDGDGFDIIELVPDYNGKIIFTTASDQHAIKAFQFSAVDYLLKPIDPILLRSAVDKLMSQLHQEVTDLSLLKANMSSPNKLALHTAEMIKISEVEEIVRLEAMGNYTNFFFTDGSKLLVTRTLKDYADLLGEHNFLRVHQSHLINLKHLNAYIKTEGGYLMMQDKSRIPVSVRKKSSVMKAIDDFTKK